AINRNNPAVLLVHSFGDSIFPANQMVDFYGRLTTPRRLEFAPGDHATVELPGLVGLPNHAWTSLRLWFDHYLRGIDSRTGDESGVVVRPHGSDAVESYPDWSMVSTRSEHDALGAPVGRVATGGLGGSAGDTADAWSQPIRAGIDTTADAGVALLTNG